MLPISNPPNIIKKKKNKNMLDLWKQIPFFILEPIKSTTFPYKFMGLMVRSRMFSLDTSILLMEE